MEMAFSSSLRACLVLGRLEELVNLIVHALMRNLQVYLFCLAHLVFNVLLLFSREYLKEDNLSPSKEFDLYMFRVSSSDLICDFHIMLRKQMMEIRVSAVLTMPIHQECA